MIKLKTSYLDQKWLENIITNNFDKFSKHEKFSIRIHTLFAINELHKEVGDQLLNEKVYKLYMKPLAADPVPNIRFNFADWSFFIYLFSVGFHPMS